MRAGVSTFFLGNQLLLEGMDRIRTLETIIVLLDASLEVWLPGDLSMPIENMGRVACFEM